MIFIIVFGKRNDYLYVLIFKATAMQKILIPTDFSENSMNAIKYATELFKYGRSEIYLLHAFSEAVYDAKARLADAVFDDLKQKALQKAEQQLEETKNQILGFFAQSQTQPPHHCRIWPFGRFGKRLGGKREY